MNGRTPLQGFALPGSLALRLAALLMGAALVAGAASGWIATRAAAEVGAEQLTSFKYRIHGSGQTRP